MSGICPTLRYVDAPKAIDWLCEAFGFERQLVVHDTEGGIAHAQLTLSGGMVMLGTAETSVEQQRSAPSAAVSQTGSRAGHYGDVRTPGFSGCYIVIDDIDAHFSRAKAAGAQIIMAPTDQDYGGRDYACLDLEGNVWAFGSYNPWDASGAPAHGKGSG